MLCDVVLHLLGALSVIVSRDPRGEGLALLQSRVTRVAFQEKPLIATK